MEQLIIFLTLIALGYSVGTITEKSHYRSIRKREREFLNLPAISMKNSFKPDSEIQDAQLVTGIAVVSLDYFKRFLAGLRNIFGGEVKSYETLIDRGRREAILRMKEMAKGADAILNIRIETSTIGRIRNNKNSVGCIEVMAYGTAITLRK
jgi:uncharacterized protein YbjQ (UPF0145 family)